ncbi:MAG: pyridoxine 5'-phosphate synthase [Candidatus Omnitrophota bacterium]
MKLGVNIDHVATLRQARLTFEPDPVFAAVLCELAGADAITVHLREDRRHINDRDVELLRKIVQTKLNLEMSVAPEIVKIALKIKPDQATLVPEKRQEVTTEGGLDVKGNFSKVKKAVTDLKRKGIIVSLFIDPEIEQINAAIEAASSAVEIHTGSYANAKDEKSVKKELDKIFKAAKYAHEKGLTVNAGHGLNYHNVCDIAKINFIEELNIGHSIVSRAIFAGLSEAVKEMKRLIRVNS